MDTPPTSEPSWSTLVDRARSESAPGIDVRASLQRQIQSERMAAPSDLSSGILDEVLTLSRGLRGLSSFAVITLSVIGFGWVMSDAIGEISLVLQLQTHFLAGL